MAHDVHIIGGGLAGSEAAWQLARRGFKVRLSEMRGTGERSPAHQGDGLAELVCSNSFRSDDDANNAVGLLHHEMRACDSLIMACAAVAQVPPPNGFVPVPFRSQRRFGWLLSMSARAPRVTSN